MVSPRNYLGLNIKGFEENQVLVGYLLLNVDIGL